MSGPPHLPAGNFSTWLKNIRRTQTTNIGIDVPCADCIACCKSSYFIHIRKEETRTLARIPKELLFKAPYMPKGNVLLGYDKMGQCPMLKEEKCLIYEDRPLTCRNYDCRIFTAAGITAGDDDKVLINRRINQWRFSYPTEQDHAQHSAVKAAARFLRDRPEKLPAGMVSKNSSELAILAVKVYDVFLKHIDALGKIRRELSQMEIAGAVINTFEMFEKRCNEQNDKQ